MSCPYENNPCKVANCKFIRDEYLEPCGLYTLLNTVKDELKASAKTGDRRLINSLKEGYVNAWNKYADSRAKGKATGTAFEKWVRKQLKQENESGKVSFSFGEFAVDAAVPSTGLAKVILEVKIYTDIQHTLALGGLLNSSPKNRKLGFVMFYEPDEREKKILNGFKKSYKNRFDYFTIEGGWSNSIERLNEFCRT